MRPRDKIEADVRLARISIDGNAPLSLLHERSSARDRLVCDVAPLLAALDYEEKMRDEADCRANENGESYMRLQGVVRRARAERDAALGRVAAVKTVITQLRQLPRQHAAVWSSNEMAHTFEQAVRGDA